MLLIRVITESTLNAAKNNYQFIISIPPLISINAFHETLALISKGFALDGFLFWKHHLSSLQEVAYCEEKKTLQKRKSHEGKQRIERMENIKMTSSKRKMLIKTFEKPLTFRAFEQTQSLQCFYLFIFILWSLWISSFIKKTR